MRILAVDQARHGAWAVYDYEEKKLLDYGTWAYDSKSYTFEQAILHIEALISEVIRTHDIDAVFFGGYSAKAECSILQEISSTTGRTRKFVRKNEYFIQFGSTYTMAKLLQSKRQDDKRNQIEDYIC